jgi:acyl-coenzyme A thioesterase PaaI-like protein
MGEHDERFGPGRFGELLGFQVVHADERGAVVEATPGPEHTNGGGIVHGGYLSALLDTLCTLGPGTIPDHRGTAAEAHRARR